MVWKYPFADFLPERVEVRPLGFLLLLVREDFFQGQGLARPDELDAVGNKRESFAG